MIDKMGETIHTYWKVGSNTHRTPFFCSYIFLGKIRGHEVVYIYKIDQCVPRKISKIDYDELRPNYKASDIPEKMINVE